MSLRLRLMILFAAMTDVFAYVCTLQANKVGRFLSQLTL
jgi:hypothetical protein